MQECDIFIIFQFISSYLTQLETVSSLFNVESIKMEQFSNERISTKDHYVIRLSRMSLLHTNCAKHCSMDISCVSPTLNAHES